MSKLAKRRIGDWAVALAVALIAIVVTWGATEVKRQGDRLDEQSEVVDVLAQALSDEQSAAEARGDEPVAPDAEDLIDDPDYEGVPGPPGPGPSDAQVYAAVSDYLRDNPVTPEGPSEAEIVAAVANYLVEFPPGPTPEQVSAAVAAYVTANPPTDGKDGADGAPGPAGAQGDPGRAPTAEEIATAVQAYMQAHPLEECPEGYHYEPHILLAADGPPIELIGCYETTA